MESLLSVGSNDVIVTASITFKFKYFGGCGSPVIIFIMCNCLGDGAWDCAVTVLGSQSSDSSDQVPE